MTSYDRLARKASYSYPGFGDFPNISPNTKYSNKKLDTPLHAIIEIRYTCHQLSFAHTYREHFRFRNAFNIRRQRIFASYFHYNSHLFFKKQSEKFLCLSKSDTRQFGKDPESAPAYALQIVQLDRKSMTRIHNLISTQIIISNLSSCLITRKERNFP